MSDLTLARQALSGQSSVSCVSSRSHSSEPLRDEVSALLEAGQADRASAIATVALHERVGEFWMWLKESR